MSNSQDNIRIVIVVQVITLTIAILGFGVNIYNTNLSKQKELETQLILNAYSLPDSAEQIKRLKNFCELNFFDDSRRKIIESKIQAGTMSAPHSSVLNPHLIEGNVMVCNAAAATKYHKRYCEGLKKCTHTVEVVTIPEAIKRGYSACGYCF